MLGTRRNVLGRRPLLLLFRGLGLSLTKQRVDTESLLPSPLSVLGPASPCSSGCVASKPKWTPSWLGHGCPVSGLRNDAERWPATFDPPRQPAPPPTPGRWTAAASARRGVNLLWPVAAAALGRGGRLQRVRCRTAASRPPPAPRSACHPATLQPPPPPQPPPRPLAARAAA